MTMKYIALAALASLAAAVALAQDTGIKRDILQRADVAQGAARESVLGTAVLPPGSNIGRHTHHGLELGYVLEGEFDLIIEGEPVKRVKAGDSYTIPAGKPHDAKNVGAAPGKVLAVWVVEKGKPLAEPAK